MKYLSLKKILFYFYDKILGSFLGFLVGTAATRLMSHYFETRSIRNLWGLTAKKTVINKHTFSNLEWIISIIIGFIVFEIITKVIKKKFDEKFPIIKVRFRHWMIRKGMYIRLRKSRSEKIALNAAMYAGTKNAIDRN